MCSYPMLMSGLAVSMLLNVLRLRNALPESVAVASRTPEAGQPRDRRSSVHDANPKVKDALQRLQRSVCHSPLL